MSLRKSGSDPTSITVPENTVHLKIGQERTRVGGRWCIHKLTRRLQLEARTTSHSCIFRATAELSIGAPLLLISFHPRVVEERVFG